MASDGAPESLFACEGGLDNRSAPISAAKGTLSACYNFEKDQGPGYVKRPGWCRYDGRIQGPENDAALVIFFTAPNWNNTFFQYGEQVRLVGPFFATLQAIVIGFSPFGSAGLPPFLVVSYPVTDFPHTVDLTAFPTNTGVTGLVSGGTLAAITSAKLMNDSTLTIVQYDAVKALVAAYHAQGVLACPGRNESPIDAIFTYGNNTYAMHDCVIFTFNTGLSGITPIEGNCIRNGANGQFMGRILSINSIGGTGDWRAGGFTGSFVVYDYPLGQAFPAAATNLDLYDATNSAVIQNTFAKFGSAAASAVDPTQTRAILYSTYEQYVKNIPMTLTAPIQSQFAPPTWSRLRLGRELPFSQFQSGSANGIGFGAIGSNQYSVYEYTRTGLLPPLNQLSPLTLGPNLGTTAFESNTVTPMWTTPNNILSNVGNATATLTPANRTTDFLQAIGFNFAIPPDASILGVQLTIGVANTIANSQYTDFSVQLAGNNFPGGYSLTNKAYHDTAGFTTVMTDRTYGGANDTWGEQLTPAILNDPSFGIAIRFLKLVAGGGSVMQTQNWRFTVFYAPKTRSVYIRDPTATTVTDVVATVVDFQIDTGDFVSNSAVGVLTIQVGATEAAGTAAGKARRIGPRNEIRDQASTGANVAHGNLLAYTTAEDYPITFPASAVLDNNSAKYEVIDANFWDVPEGRAAFFVNGVEYACMFDGTYFVRIHTGRTAQQDNPRHVAQHGSPTPYLYLGFASGALSSTGGGHPTHYLGSPDPQTFVFGEPITGLLSVNGQTLGVWTDRATRGLQGNNPATATPFMISPAINCIEYTLVNLVGEAVWTSYRGVETLRTVNAYGDFETLPLSAAAQLWLQPRLQVDSRIGSRVSRAVYAIGIRNKRQYRLFFQDGYFFTLTMFDAGDLPVCMTGRMIRPNSPNPEGNASFPFNNEPYNSGVIRHVYNGTRSDGKELILASFENENASLVPAGNGGNQVGPYFPYGARLDCGFTDDVLPSIPCYIEFNAIYAGNPVQTQQFGSVTLFVQAYGGTVFSVYTKTDYDGPIFDQANNAPLVGAPPASDIFQQNIALPIIESRAFIPIPNRQINFSIGGYGEATNSLKLRIDGTQLSTVTPTVVPMRITHINLETMPGSVKTG